MTMNLENSMGNAVAMLKLATTFIRNVVAEEAVASLVVGLRAALNGKEISTAVVQHFFVTQRRHTVEEAIANVGAVVKDMEDREKRQQDELHDAEEEVAEKEQDEDGEEDDEDGEEDSKATMEGAAAAPEAARATVIHVHVHQHEKN